MIAATTSARTSFSSRLCHSFRTSLFFSFQCYIHRWPRLHLLGLQRCGSLAVLPDRVHNLGLPGPPVLRPDRPVHGCAPLLHLSPSSVSPFLPRFHSPFFAVMDESGSIAPADFRTEMNFAVSVANSYTFGSQAVRTPPAHYCREHSCLSHTLASPSSKWVWSCSPPLPA